MLQSALNADVDVGTYTENELCNATPEIVSVVRLSQLRSRNRREEKISLRLLHCTFDSRKEVEKMCLVDPLAFLYFSSKT